MEDDVPLHVIDALGEVLVQDEGGVLDGDVVKVHLIHQGVHGSDADVLVVEEVVLVLLIVPAMEGAGVLLASLARDDSGALVTDHTVLAAGNALSPSAEVPKHVGLALPVLFSLGVSPAFINVHVGGQRNMPAPVPPCPRRLR